MPRGSNSGIEARASALSSAPCRHQEPQQHDKEISEIKIEPRSQLNRRIPGVPASVDLVKIVKEIEGKYAHSYDRVKDIRCSREPDKDADQTDHYKTKQAEEQQGHQKAEINMSGERDEPGPKHNSSRSHQRL